MPNLHQPKPFLIITAITLATLLALMPHRAYACSCVVPGPPAEALIQADALFAGRVTYVPPPQYGNPMILRRVTFDVSQVWKGPTYQTLIIHTAQDVASCGYPFQTDQEYLVYAYTNGDDLRVSLCSRTNLLANATEDLSALGTGTVPTAENPAPTSQLGLLLQFFGVKNNTAHLTYVPPVALIGILSALPIGAHFKASLRRRSK